MTNREEAACREFTRRFLHAQRYREFLSYELAVLIQLTARANKNIEALKVFSLEYQNSWILFMYRISLIIIN